MITLNPNLRNSKKEDIIKLAKRSIIQEKIKKIEIEKNFKNPKIPQKFQERIHFDFRPPQILQSSPSGFEVKCPLPL